MNPLQSIHLRRTFSILHDLLWIPAAVLAAYWLRFNLEPLPAVEVDGFWKLLSVAVPVHAVALFAFGLHRGLWNFVSLPDLLRIARAVLVGALVSALLMFVLHRGAGIPRTVILLYPLLLMLGLSIPRLLYRLLRERQLHLMRREGQRTLIYGAGRAGELLVRDLANSSRFEVVGLIDDNPAKLGREIHGLRVYGSGEELAEIVRQLEVTAVLLAMPAAPHAAKQRVVNKCQQLGLKCRTVPSLKELVDGGQSVSQVRQVELEDLLGREPVALEQEAIRALIAGKRVLITGAGGSIGSELCRQVLHLAPASLILVEHSEFNLYQIDQELLKRPNGERIVPLLGDVRDESRLRRIFAEHRPEILFHAAAYKHVPLVEANPVEGMRTNVFGSRLLADLADEFGVERFSMISTDKAVNPTNVMGASKRAAEIYCQNLNGRSATRFITTRFGNVLGSAGSVVPLFKKQIAEGGPVTVTHPEISRYFMTIPEAVSLVLQAATMGEGGEIFVLDMGEPVKIVDLAEQMIRLSGFAPGRDIEIAFTGLRPGEKLFEELFHASEELLATRHPKIRLAASRAVAWEELQGQLFALGSLCAANEKEAAINGLRRLVPEFHTAAS